MTASNPDVNVGLSRSLRHAANKLRTILRGGVC